MTDSVAQTPLVQDASADNNSTSTSINLFDKAEWKKLTADQQTSLRHIFIDAGNFSNYRINKQPYSYIIEDVNERKSKTRKWFQSEREKEINHPEKINLTHMQNDLNVFENLYDSKIKPVYPTQTIGEFYNISVENSNTFGGGKRKRKTAKCQMKKRKATRKHKSK